MPNPASVVTVATISRFLRQETARPKSVNSSRMARGPRPHHVEAQGGLPQQGCQHHHGRQAMDRGGGPPLGRRARRPHQPEERVDHSHRHSGRRRQRVRFREGPQQVGARQAEKRAAQHRQKRGCLGKHGRGRLIEGHGGRRSRRFGSQVPLDLGYAPRQVAKFALEHFQIGLRHGNLLANRS